MSVKLTDVQLVMMSAAAQRKDRCLSAPATIKGAARRTQPLALITKRRWIAMTLWKSDFSMQSALNRCSLRGDGRLFLGA
jgi:hypothetical protein